MTGRSAPATPRTGLGATTPLVLPFAWLCADNRRFLAVAGRHVLTREYRQAKTAVTMLARSWWRGDPLTGDVVLTVRAWWPDRRKRDLGNYRKLITDALSGVVYDDDVQIAHETYTRMGIDRDHPRVEVCVAPQVSLLSHEDAA